MFIICIVFIMFIVGNDKVEEQNTDFFVEIFDILETFLSFGLCIVSEKN